MLSVGVNVLTVIFVIDLKLFHNKNHHTNNINNGSKYLIIYLNQLYEFIKHIKFHLKAPIKP